MAINFEDKEFDKVQKEGIAIAIDKLREKLMDAFYERATLYELSGPAYNLVKRKVAANLKNLKRLGAKPTESEQKDLRDSANKEMYNVAKAELERVHIAQQKRQNPMLEKREKQLIKLMQRLEEESNIRVPHHPEIKELFVREKGNLAGVKASA